MLELKLNKKRWKWKGKGVKWRKIQRLRSYESAKAEANAVAKFEEEEKNPDLLDLKQYQIAEDNKEERMEDYISHLC